MDEIRRREEINAIISGQRAADAAAEIGADQATAASEAIRQVFESIVPRVLQEMKAALDLNAIECRIERSEGPKLPWAILFFKRPERRAKNCSFSVTAKERALSTHYGSPEFGAHNEDVPSGDVTALEAKLWDLFKEALRLP